MITASYPPLMCWYTGCNRADQLCNTVAFLGEGGRIHTHKQILLSAFSCTDVLKFIIIPPYYPTFQKFVNTQPQEERNSKYVKRIRGHYSHLITSETDPYAVPFTTPQSGKRVFTIQVAVINQEADNRLNAFLSLPVTSHYSSCSCNNLAPHVPRSGEGSRWGGSDMSGLGVSHV